MEGAPAKNKKHNGQAVHSTAEIAKGHRHLARQLNDEHASDPINARGDK
jgi:hypothetical protein